MYGHAQRGGGGKKKGRGEGIRKKREGRSDIRSLHPAPNPWHYGAGTVINALCQAPKSTDRTAQHFALRSEGQASSSLPSGRVLFVGYKTADCTMEYDPEEYGLLNCPFLFAFYPQHSALRHTCGSRRSYLTKKEKQKENISEIK